MASRLVDVRYTRYEGPRRGQVAGVLSLARWSALRALGLRRGWKAKVIPIVVIVLAFGPAFVSLGIRALVPGNVNFDFDRFLPYTQYLGLVSTLIIVFSVVIAPELLCPDRRDRVLDLYYPTAISPRLYLLAKVIAAVVPTGIVTVLPLVVLYLGRVTFAVHPVGYVQAQGALPLRIAAAGTLVAAYFALLALAIASFTQRRPFAMGAVAGIIVASAAVAATLSAGLSLGPGYRVLALPVIPIQIAERLLGREGGRAVGTGSWVIAYLVVVAISSLVLLLRYRKGDNR
jgi:ABC-2 type transport system permease protein